VPVLTQRREEAKKQRSKEAKKQRSKEAQRVQQSSITKSEKWIQSQNPFAKLCVFATLRQAISHSH
jgi:hypothetical protein